MSGKSITLWNGREMPLVGLGTWQSTESDVQQAVEWALEAGYRHFDTAYMYFNEAAIGEVFDRWIGSGKIKREELFITTKLPPIGNHPDKVEHFMKLSLKNLKLDYVDLYLIHLPMGMVGKHDFDVMPNENGLAVLDKTTSLEVVWEAMEKVVDSGLAKSIGLSNFNSKQIERIIKVARIKPANLQVEVSAYFQQKKLREVCNKHGITVCAYGPLGSSGRVEFYKQFGQTPEVPGVLKDPEVLQIAKNHSRTPAQILLRHLIQQGIVVIPKSVSQSRIKENFNVFDFVLSKDEMERLNQLDKNTRSTWMDILAGMKEHPEYPFNIPF